MKYVFILFCMDILDEICNQKKKYVTKSKNTKPSVHVLSPNKFPIRVKGDPKPYNSYAEYLKSNHWIDFRRSVLKRRSKRARKVGKLLRCYCCETPTQNLELHHRTYKRIGRELPHDVEPVCRECHQRIHNFIKEKCSAKTYSPVFLGTLLKKLSWREVRKEKINLPSIEKTSIIDSIC